MSLACWLHTLSSWAQEGLAKVFLFFWSVSVLLNKLPWHLERMPCPVLVLGFVDKWWWRIALHVCKFMTLLWSEACIGQTDSVNKYANPPNASSPWSLVWSCAMFHYQTTRHIPLCDIFVPVSGRGECCSCVQQTTWAHRCVVFGLVFAKARRFGAFQRAAVSRNSKFSERLRQQNYNRGRNHDTKACSKTADTNGPNQSNGELIGQKHELGTGWNRRIINIWK